ncbi:MULTISPECIES: DUF202 domain-containing protein [Comamonas]|uniref:DUF202 domain-containing protein n=1 Tax=Comamonas TaxID=283 RepID=UPI00050E0640|nr:hypothetical protein P369_09280 [Comamonas thiooxydans]KGG98524.1 hypothetical protein P367_12185 [Comamonas thiooxydans]KGH04473.1 hypothetical protein P365_12350 [Comamonas thiooxydans]KGH12983.1 hypothetical protein P368_10535 [Comamonas thiooxydans]TZG06855.1 DUF202 domain-containing protein [Comamonas thiooxydans]
MKAGRYTRDVGLQPERTAMSWTRTASSLILNAFLVLRYAQSTNSFPLAALAIVIVVSAAAIYAEGLNRQSSFSIEMRPHCTSNFSLKFVAASTLFACVTGLGAIAWRHMADT